ncbi:MAG: hypothetical protein V3S80_01555, partial [Sulfurimonadaceae bacterium]
LLSTFVVSALLAEVPPLKPTSERTFSQSQYIPDISLITDFSYVYRNMDDSELGHLELPGVAHGLMGSHSHGEHSHATYNANNGFNLNYAELVLSSNVDPYFSMDAVFHFSEHGVEIEEAYFTTSMLPAGLRVRGGKLLSNFGRLNAQHHHFWDFGDMPLVYEAFLGNHGINELGAQLQWTAPTPFYLMAGVEVLQGNNEAMFGNDPISDPNNPDPDAEPLGDEVRAPSMYVGYVKTSFDIGNTTILPGLSYAYGSSRIDHFEDEEGPHAFSGDSALYGADLTIKHYFDSYSFLTWQSEWLMRDMEGTQYNNIDTDADDVPDTTVTADLTKKQSGYYTQLVYAYNQNWRVAARYDNIYQNDVTANGIAKDLPNDFNRYSAMAEYHPSEFSRIRLQYNRNNAMYNEDGEQQNIDTVMVQFNIAIGAHGAHSF